MSEQKINLNIIEGDAFFSHETSINFSPTQFFLDFKCVTPRLDQRGQKPSINLKHNVVMVDPVHAKSMLELLKNSVKTYEKKFGKIDMPKKQKSKSRKKQITADTIIPSYLG